MTQISSEEQPNVEKQEEVISSEENTQESNEEKKPELTPEEELAQLKDFRKNGSITVHTKYDTFKKVRNTFKNDVPWKGPNQAYLLSILNLNLEASLSALDAKSSETQAVQLRNDSVEAISVFLGSIEGKNSHSASTNLPMFLVLQNAIHQLQAVDARIHQLTAEDKK